MPSCPVLIRPTNAQMRCPSDRLVNTCLMCTRDTAARSRDRPAAATGSKIISGCAGRPAPKSLAAPLPRPAPKSLTQQSVPWRHLPQPVSDEELKLDQARCSLAAKMALGAGSTEMKFNLVFADCMRSKGYDPI